MFNSGCLEIVVVAAALVGTATFVVACVFNLHTGITLPLAALKALLTAAISFGSTALFLTLASAALQFFGGKITKRKLRRMELFTTPSSVCVTKIEGAAK